MRKILDRTVSIKHTEYGDEKIERFAKDLPYEKYDMSYDAYLDKENDLSEYDNQDYDEELEFDDWR